MAGCFLLDSPIKIQYSTSCDERGPLLKRKYFHNQLDKWHSLPTELKDGFVNPGWIQAFKFGPILEILELGLSLITSIFRI